MKDCGHPNHGNTDHDCRPFLPPDPVAERGLYGKYLVFKAGGDMVPVTDPCFVLRYTTDPHARAALTAYADSCEANYPQLAADLRARLT